jgi:uncharacterized RDD family membrane protein YckC
MIGSDRVSGDGVGDDVRYVLAEWTSEQLEDLRFLLVDAGIPSLWLDEFTFEAPRSSYRRVQALVEQIARPPAGFDEPSDTGRGVARPHYASPWRRGLGYFIDSTVLLPVTGLRWVLDDQLALLLTIVAGALYDTVLIGRWGQTVGCRAMRLRIVRVSDEGPLDYRAAFVRWVVPAGATLLLLVTGQSGNSDYRWLSIAWGLAVYLPMFFTVTRQGLMDRAAGDAVVDERT